MERNGRSQGQQCQSTSDVCLLGVLITPCVPCRCDGLRKLHKVHEGLNQLLILSSLYRPWRRR